MHTEIQHKSSTISYNQSAKSLFVPHATVLEAKAELQVLKVKAKGNRGDDPQPIASMNKGTKRERKTE